MYAKFFGLRQEPFSIAPDPHYLFMSERHREALAHLLYGAKGGGGFVLLTGEIGAGKTTVCRCFLEQIPKRCNVAYIFNPQLTAPELLKTVCDEFSIPYAQPEPDQPKLSVKDYLDPINEFLLRTHAVGLSNILIVDEAQQLSIDVLEQLRLLTNLETNERKLLQIILIGQPELRDLLARPELQQLAQRVIARFHLEALSETETSRYIRHRLAVAGQSGIRPFSARVRRRIYAYTRGIPRLINLLCDRALLGAYAVGKTEIDLPILNKAAAEVFALQPPVATPWWRRSTLWLGLTLALCSALVGGLIWGLYSGSINLRTPLQKPNAPVAASTAQQPDPKPLIRNEDEAWRELSPLWGVDAPPGKPCEVLPAKDLQCYKGTVTLGLIRQLERPGILTLQDDKAKPAYALLLGLGDQNVQLKMSGATKTMSISTLTRLWNGEFATLYKKPLPSNAATQALANQLAQALGEKPTQVSAALDATLQTKLQAFQKAQSLPWPPAPDGTPDPRTQMQLNRATGPSEPKLQRLEGSSNAEALP